MKGDRFEKMASSEGFSVDGPVVKLLRKEHAAVVKMVEAKKRTEKGAVYVGYNQAVADILAALDRRAKGGTK